MPEEDERTSTITNEYWALHAESVKTTKYLLHRNKYI
jgi:hypothetical protein